jgi:hypothetical protein
MICSYQKWDAHVTRRTIRCCLLQARGLIFCFLDILSWFCPTTDLDTVNNKCRECNDTMERDFQNLKLLKRRRAQYLLTNKNLDNKTGAPVVLSPDTKFPLSFLARAEHSMLKEIFWLRKHHILRLLVLVVEKWSQHPLPIVDPNSSVCFLQNSTVRYNTVRLY